MGFCQLYLIHNQNEMECVHLCRVPRAQRIKSSPPPLNSISPLSSPRSHPAKKAELRKLEEQKAAVEDREAEEAKKAELEEMI